MNLDHPVEEASAMMQTDDDPLRTDPGHYRLLWENEHVRVLDYTDVPGDETHVHRHPATVMVTLTGFDRRLVADGRELDVALPGGTAVWLPAQRHSGRNTGSTPTHTILVELLDVPVEDPDPTVLGLGPRQG